MPDKQKNNITEFTGNPAAPPPNCFTMDAGGLGLALEYIGFSIRRNTRTNAIEYLTEDTFEVTPEWRTLNDDVENLILDTLQQRCVRQQTLAKEIRYPPYKWAAREWNVALGALLAVNRCDPFRAWLESLDPWDKTPRLERVLLEVMGADASTDDRADMAAWAARNIFMGAIRRAYEPGCVHDQMVVLIGEQNRNKSSFFKEIFPTIYQDSWYSGDLNLDAMDPRMLIEQIYGPVLIESQELQGARKADTLKLKAFITRRTDRVRLAYERNVAERRRSSIMVATANDDGSGVLPEDVTGNRRFLPIHVDGLDGVDGYKKLARYMDAHRIDLWAEALQAYEDDQPCLLPGHLYEAQRDETEQLTAGDPGFDDSVSEIIRDPDVQQQLIDGMTMKAIALKMDMDMREYRNPRTAHFLARSLTRHGLYQPPKKTGQPRLWKLKNGE